MSARKRPETEGASAVSGSATSLPLCPGCGEPSDPRLADTCKTCNSALAPLDLGAAVRGEPRPGEVVTLRLQARARRPLGGVAISVGVGQRFLSEESALQVEFGALTPERHAEAPLPVVPRLGGTLPLELIVRFQDDGHDWVLATDLALPVAQAAGSPIINVGDVHVDTSLRTSVVLDFGGLRADSTPNTSLDGSDVAWTDLSLTLRDFLPRGGRAVQAGSLVGGRWEVMRLVGRGAFGSVWLTYRADEPGEAYVLKTLLPALASDVEAVRAFRREVRLTRKLTHERVVRLWDHGVHDDTPYLVMEFVEGPSGRDLLRERPGGLPADEVAAIGADLCEALAYAHGLSPPLFHRDVKPGNFLLDRRGRAKLADFGLADEARSQLSRITGAATGGTATYSSPEQLQNQPATEAQDIYSLGATLYELTAGRPPFEGSTIQVITQVLSGIPKPLQGIPDWLAEAIAVCLSKEASERPSAAELRATFQRSGAPTPAEVEEQARQGAEQAARQEAEEAARQEAEEAGRQEAEEAARQEAEERARRQANELARRKRAELARQRAAELARQQAEELARIEAEDLARLEAEEQARQEAELARQHEEELARVEAEDRLDAQDSERGAREAVKVLDSGARRRSPERVMTARRPARKPIGAYVALAFGIVAMCMAGLIAVPFVTGLGGGTGASRSEALGLPSDASSNPVSGDPACGNDNDLAGDGTSLVPDITRSGRICADDRVDWYVLQAPAAGARAEVQLSFEHDIGDLDLKLFRGDVEVDSSTGTTDSETVDAVYDGTAPLYAKVTGHSGATNRYDISVSYEAARTSGNPCSNADDSSSGATRLTAGTWPGKLCDDDAQDWFAFDGLTQDSRLRFTMQVGEGAGDLDVKLYRGNEEVGISSGVGSTEVVSAIFDGSSPLRARVYGHNGATGPYTVTVGYQAPVDPCATSDDTRDGAVELGAGTWSGGEICPSDREDWFVLSGVPRGATVEVAARFVHSRGDLEARLFRGSTEIATSTTSSDDELLTGVQDASGPLSLRVYGYESATNTYTLEVTYALSGCETSDDTRGGAVTIGVGTHTGGRICSGDRRDFLRIPASSEADDVRVEYEHSSGDLDARLYDAAGRLLRSSAGSSGSERFDFPGGPVFLEVYGYEAAKGSYRVIVD